MTQFPNISVWCKTLGLLLSTAFVATAAYAKPDYNALINDTKQAYTDGAYERFNRLAAQMPSDHLYAPLVEIWRFRFDQRLAPGAREEDRVWPSAAVQPLLSKHENTWPAETLRRDWLQQLARTGQWELYAQHRPGLRYRLDQGTECADLMHSVHQGQLVRENLDRIITSDRKLARTCRVLLKQLYDAKVINASDLDRHVLQMIGANRVSNAVEFIQELGSTAWGRQINVATLRNAAANPARFIGNPGEQPTDLYMAAALSRRAVEDPKAAAGLMGQAAGKRLSPATAQWAWAHIGYRAALLWDTEALSYFRRSAPAVMSPTQQEWMVRSALLLEDWNAVHDSIATMGPQLQGDSTWTYWMGRALAVRGDLVGARQHWIRISDPFNFYGKLATEELGSTVAAPRRPALLSADELNRAKNNPGLQRALALYDAGLRTEAFWEFNLQVAQMGDRDLLAAATWAERNQLYDRAIAAADRTNLEHDLGLRYLTPFREQLQAKSREVGVDEAWVYGLIRQESRFVTVARSHVGASGLMQVMPATASYVAKKIGLTGFNRSQINEIDTNLTLGTNYLKMVYEQHDQSPVLASAGYNAGPSRPATWKRRLGSNRVVEGAIFAELIPFDETRGYVKNVMSNTVAYSLLLNNGSKPLKERLGIIRGSN